MRPLILTTIVAATAATLLPTPSSAQTTPFCIAGRGCVPATQASYNGCFQLALSRGLTVSRGDLNNLNSFIYQCLQGRIPR